MVMKIDTQKEIVFGLVDPNVCPAISKMVKDGDLRK